LIRYKILIFLILLPVTVTVAQSRILDKYIEIGLQNNLELLQEVNKVAQQRTQLKAAKGNFLPQITLDANYTRADGGRTIDFPVGDLLNPVYQTLNQLTGSQQFPQNLPNESIQFLPDDYQETKLRILQPLFNADIYFNYRAQRDLVDLQTARLEVYKRNLRKEIAVAYYRLLQAEMADKIYRESRVVLQELLRINRKLVAAQTATKDVVSRSEYELSKIEQQLANSRKNIELAKAYFNFLLNRPLTEAVELDTLIGMPATEQTADSALQNALSMRTELAVAQSGINLASHQIKLARGGFLPTAYIAAEAGYQGFQYKFDDTQAYWLVRVGLSWNLFNGMKTRAALQKAKIEHRNAHLGYQLLEQQIALEVQNAYFGLEAAKAELSAAEKGVTAAGDAFRIIKRKYEAGQALLIEFLEAQANATAAKLQREIARYNVMIEQANYRNAIGY
jgi:outer membrane protein TolC